MVLACSSCGSRCYEIIEVQENRYDISTMMENRSVGPDELIGQKALDPTADHLFHQFNRNYSLSKNYFGVEVTDRPSHRRFVKRTSDQFEEQMRHQDNPFVAIPTPTGRTRQIGRFHCEEFILETEKRPHPSFYVARDYPFIYLYENPFQFPGFVVASQMYEGDQVMVETIYDLRKARCSDLFLRSIREVDAIK